MTITIGTATHGDHSLICSANGHTNMTVIVHVADKPTFSISLVFDGLQVGNSIANTRLQVKENFLYNAAPWVVPTVSYGNSNLTTSSWVQNSPNEYERMLDIAIGTCATSATYTVSFSNANFVNNSFEISVKQAASFSISILNNDLQVGNSLSYATIEVTEERVDSEWVTAEVHSVDSSNLSIPFIWDDVSTFTKKININIGSCNTADEDPGYKIRISASGIPDGYVYINVKARAT
jgi:hypothetical protein